MAQTKAIRVSLEVYDKLCELGKTNNSFAEVVDKIFRDNNLIAVVMDRDELEE